MPTEEKILRDDPQIHLLAAKYCEKIREIVPENVNDEQVQVLKSCIQFFAHYVKCLPECVNDVLKMCRCFLTAIKNNSVDFDVAAVNRIVGICSTMLIRRKEEDVIRSTCVVLKETLKIIPQSTLTVIVTKYAKTLSFIFQKIYLVQTYFTQLQVLEIFIFITKDLKKLLSDTISKHHLMRNAKDETVKLVIDKLNKIDYNDFENTSRKFLRFYNNNLFPKTCILSVEGRMTKMNGHPIKQKENMLINFNGRNLTVSFFIPNSLFSSQENASQQNDFLVFIEFECKSITSTSKVYKGRHYVDVSIDVSQAATYDQEMNRESLDEIKKVSLRLIDEESTLEKFSDLFFEKFKQNERMMSDHASGVDKMSIMTFQTSASMLNDLQTKNETKTQFNQKIQTQNLLESTKIEKLSAIQNKPRTEEIVSDNLKIKKEAAPLKKASAQTKPSQAKSRPKRQSAKKAGERLSDIYDEDNMQEDCEAKLPTYRDFKAQQKNKETELPKTAKNKRNSQDSNRNYYLKPVEIITRTTLKSKTTKVNKYESKQKHFDTDDENREIKHKNRATKKDVKKQELKLQPVMTRQRQVKESEERNPLANFDMNKNITKDKIDLKSTNIKEQRPVQQYQKRKFPESRVPDKPLIDDNMEIDPPIKMLNQSNRKYKVAEKPSDESFNSGLSRNLVFYKEKPAMKRPKEADKPEDRVEKRRRLTIDNVFELCGSDKDVPKTTEATSKVEEWLKSTSDSFSLDISMDNVEPENLKIQRIVQIQKEAPNEDADNESETSFGHFANDEHQHYSSSSHESMDLDVKNIRKQMPITSRDEKKPKMNQNYRFEYPSTSYQDDNASQIDSMARNKNVLMDPCKAFNIRSREAAMELALRKKKIDDSSKNIFKKYDHSIAKLGRKCLEQVQKTKVQLKHVNQLHLRYESEKSKLMNELTEQEKMFLTLKREVGKRTEALELHSQNKKKELMNLKKEALRKNEELMQDVWRDYINNFQSCFNNSIQKAYEI